MLLLRGPLGFRYTQLLKPRSYLVPRRNVKTSTVDWKPIRGLQGDLATLEHQSKTPKLRKFFFALLIAMPVISFGLGCWQVKRLDWKVKLIAKNEKALAAPVIEDVPTNLDPTVIAEEFEYRKFKLKGRFDYQQEMFLGPRIRNGDVGYLVVTPFVRSDGGKPILIERGWIRKEKVIPTTRNTGYLSHLAMPQGEIEIVALFRKMPRKHALHFDHEEGSRLFHTPDVLGMAQLTGSLPIYAQMIYDLLEHPDWKAANEKEKASHSNSGSGWKHLFSRKKPVDEDTKFITDELEHDSTLNYQEIEFINEGVPLAHTAKVKLSNNHLQYLVTWFGLSFCSAGLLLWMFYKNKNYSSADKIIAAKRKDMKNKF